jgi:hypothetical protein
MPGRPPTRAAACRLALACATLALCGGRARATETATPAAHEVPHAPELTLAWQAPASCPSSLDVETQFVRLLGGATRTPSGKHIDASALVRAPSADHWSLELSTTLDGAPGRRSLTGDSCASVSSAAALILALMIDPAAAERALLAPPAHAPEPPPPPLAHPPEAVVAAAPAPEPPPVRAFARLLGGAVVALLPEPAPAAGLAVGARRRWLAGELRLVATTERRVNATPDVGGDFRLLVAGARACGALGGRAVVWQLCAGGEIERLTGHGVASPAATDSALMGAGTGGLLVTVPLGARVGLSLDVDGALRLYHPGFCAFCTTTMPGTPIFRVPVASAFAALGFFVTI